MESATPSRHVPRLRVALGFLLGAFVGGFVAEMTHRHNHQWWYEGIHMHRIAPARNALLFLACIMSGGVLGMALACWRRLGSVERGAVAILYTASLLLTPSLLCAGERPTKHWAFQPLRDAPPPEVKDAAWPRNDIDRFIRSAQEKEGIQPAAEAPRRVLIRRLYLDLLGLPPTPEEIEAFEKDTRADAYDKLVERLLASPHYGERWARHWLDVARWAESEGYESNHPRPFAWRYRDWVVKAFNEDMPFKDFVRAQIAGDELTPYADDNLIATGFLAAARLSSNEEDRWRQKNDIYVDIVNATGSAFLGLTLQCAQCHDHRFDPISIRDYYRFLGFFVQGQPGNLALKDKSLWDAHAAKKPKEYDDLVRERDHLFELGRSRRLAEVRKGLPKETQDVLALPQAKRSMAQERIYRETDLLFQFAGGQIENALTPEERKTYNDVKKKVADMEATMLPVPQTFGFFSPVTSPCKVVVLPMKGFYPLAYRPAELADARPYLLDRGDVHRPRAELEVGWPAMFGPGPKEKRPSRLVLADWLVEQPLVARVFVNRVWQWHFGRGLVESSADFGLKGTPPTHPELLDWLAREFLKSGGSTRHLHRLIVTSATYRQASQARPEALKKDPENRTWRNWMPRRLEAEAIRDCYLAVADNLDRTVGGASVAASEKVTRRSLYLTQKRDLPADFLALFDGPTAITESCTRRQTTTVPLQSLYLLNSPFSQQAARALADRVAKIAGTDETVNNAFRLALGRAPDERERTLARRFLEREGNALRNRELLCQALLNLNEFLYIE